MVCAAHAGATSAEMRQRKRNSQTDVTGAPNTRVRRWRDAGPAHAPLALDLLPRPQSSTSATPTNPRAQCHATAYATHAISDSTNTSGTRLHCLREPANRTLLTDLWLLSPDRASASIDSGVLSWYLRAGGSQTRGSWPRCAVWSSAPRLSFAFALASHTATSALLPLASLWSLLSAGGRRRSDTAITGGLAQNETSAI
jgi:hypothetical protein